MFSFKNQKGSLHLTAVLLAVVVVAIAAIGVKIFGDSHANELGSNLIAITRPTAGQTLSGYQLVLGMAQQTKRQVTGVKFYANGKLIQSASLTNCYPSGIVPMLPARTYANCLSTTTLTNGSYSLTAKMSFLNGSSVVSFPVNVNVNNPVAVPPSVKIDSPNNNSFVNGYVPVLVHYSPGVTLGTVTVNGADFTDAGLAKCYPNGPLPAITADTYLRCLDTTATAYAQTPTLTIKATGTTADNNGAGILLTDTVTVTHPIIEPSPTQ